MNARSGRSERPPGTDANRRDRRRARSRNSEDVAADPSPEALDRERRRAAREEERRRVKRSRRRGLLIASAVVAVIVAGVIAVYFTPLLTVRSIEVDGNSSVSTEEIVGDLAIPLGERLVHVDTGAAAQRVAGIPALASARVQRMYPSTVRVTVVERVAVVFVDQPDGTHLLDSDGVDFAVAPPPPGTVRLVTDTPGVDDPATESALAVLDSLPESLRGMVGEVRASSISDVSMLLLDGRTLVWGNRDNAERKSAVALALMSQPGQILDVSSPDLPTTK
ncbi:MULTISPECIES: cell division protein FtsQ/DivIB [unclassified Rhodococcus (in: high G+C Gram-positive bacteria)]|uniref:cell division protein FtsQ/DivIB n=1 Tax=unclassified Rhodococcus (in: high G+C Gram-positive bacteria) TaxID=192944 RepID=UPI001FB3CCDC|nr:MULTISPECIES: FtsQ-type POTRA domain-containing protein [unclassified Rhodococcus (in: high G+C Gram-positive bacteria)]